MKGPKQPYVRNVLLRQAEEIATLKADVAELKGEDAKIVEGLRGLATEAAQALNDQAEAVTETVLLPQGTQLAWQHQQLRAIDALLEGGRWTKLKWLLFGTLPIPFVQAPPAPTPPQERVRLYQTGKPIGADAAALAGREAPQPGSGWKGGIGGMQ